MIRVYSLGRLTLMVLLSMGTAGHTVAAQNPLTLREVLSRAVRSNPELRAYEYLLVAQDGRIAQAGVKPNPTLNADLENVLGTGDVSGVKGAELTLGLSQLIEIGGLRDRRVEVARAERDGLESEKAIRRLDLVAETARRFITLVSMQEQHALTHRSVTLAEETLAAARLRVEAARSPQAEQDRAAVALERARIADAHAEHALVSARYSLAESWGAEQPDFEAVTADLYALPAPVNYDGLVRSLEQTPDISRYISESRLRESEIRLHTATRRPGMEVGAGVRRMETTNDMALVFSFSVPLGVNNRNEGLIAEARARRDGAEANRAVDLLKARTRLGQLYRELQDRAREVPALRDRALPQMEEALRNTTYAFERGRYSYLELIDAQRELLDLQADLIDAATEYHQTLIEIERLTGTAAIEEGTQP
jgi:cobalt-zinc-cadmium efflux system outer membrane protein